MDIFISVLLLVVGMALLIVGGNFFVDAATWLSEKLRIPKFIIGATIVSLCTTLPELIVSSMATSRGELDIAVGNAIGSVIGNTGLILAISIIGIPAAIKRKDLWRKYAILMGAAMILFVCSLIFKEINLVVGIILFALFILFMVENLLSAKKNAAEEAAKKAEERARMQENGEDISEEPEKNKKKMTVKEWLNILKFALGITALIFGSDLMVDHGKKLALLAGVPEGIIAVTIIAIGTSLPELVSTITALAKKQPSLSVGNILGANVLNFTLILPISTFISGGALAVSSQTMQLDFPMGILVSLIAFLPALIFGKFKRWQGIALLAAYAAYLILLMIFFI